MIHLFERAGMKMVLDVGSGAVHILDSAAYDLLGCLSEKELKSGHIYSDILTLKKQYGEQEIKTAFSELCELTKQGLLYEDDSYADFENSLGPAPVKALCLHIAHDCNLRCKYCFASTGGFGGIRKLMDFPTAKAAIDLLIGLSDKQRNLEVDVFGGEPLLNYEVICQTVKYARSIEQQHGKNFRFTLTTNGVDLCDEKMEFINLEMSNVVLSLDGRKEVNDSMRPFANGSGSFEKIVPNFQKFVHS
ncbi:MAG: radical SAM protein, partial [Saezia sp.]